jgi:hypothetical protein
VFATVSEYDLLSEAAAESCVLNQAADIAQLCTCSDHAALTKNQFRYSSGLQKVQSWFGAVSCI